MDSSASMETFLVFKSASSVSLDELRAQEVAELRAQYVLLKAVESKDELTEKTLLGRVAPAEKMVVDRADFKEQVAKKIREEVALKRSQDVEASIERLKTQAEEMFRQEVRMMRENLLKEVLSIVDKDDLDKSQRAEQIRKAFADVRIEIEAEVQSKE